MWGAQFKFRLHAQFPQLLTVVFAAGLSERQRAICGNEAVRSVAKTGYRRYVSINCGS